MTPATPPNEKPEFERGITCRDCGCGHFSTIETRKQAGAKIMRRRQCRNCGKRITTYERAFGTS